MKICVCEKTGELRERKVQLIEGYFLEKNMEAQVETFESGERLLSAEAQLDSFDVFFIDIALGDNDALNIITELKETYNKQLFILTGNNYECLDAAMDLNVLRYIINPAPKEKVYSALDKALEEMKHSLVRLKTKNNDIVYLHKNDIIFAEAKQRKTYIYTTNGVVQINKGITQIDELLNTPNFIKPHYSFVVNKDFISYIEGRDIIMKVNYHYVRVPIAAKKLANVRKQLIL